MTDPFAIGISGVSLTISLVVAYRAEFRGSHMTVSFRKPPIQWAVAPARQTAGRLPGLSSLASFEEASWIQMAGQCQATVDNDGPRGGAIWDVALGASGLPDRWAAHGNFGEQPFSLDGKSSRGFNPTFLLVCQKGDFELGAKALLESSGFVTLRISYQRTGLFGRAVPDGTQIEVPCEVLRAALTTWAEENGVALASDPTAR
jgi:hypothetical protein